MENIPDKKNIEALYVIVNPGLGSKVIKIGKQNGITGGTIFLGMGTVKNRFLEFLGISDIRKEIVLMICSREMAYNVLEKLNDKFHFDKPHNGIAYSISVDGVFGTQGCESRGIDQDEKSRGGKNSMYKAIYTIVDRGKAEYVMEAATNAGAKGGTIINARGSGIHENETLFSMPIEPEKEMVMILAESHIVDGIISSIREKLRIDEPGNGIIFVQDVNRTYGLR